MITEQRALTHSVQSSTLADILERVLDKGIVIAGDIKIKLVDVELLTIQIRLMIASVDKAKELGMDWWARNPDLTSAAQGPEVRAEVNALEQRIEQLETQVRATKRPGQSKQPAERKRRSGARKAPSQVSGQQSALSGRPSTLTQSGRAVSSGPADG